MHNSKYNFIIYNHFSRRRQLVRKFGSAAQLPAATAGGELKEKEDQAGMRTTRPNHYISDHQLVMDAQGRSVLTSTLPAGNPTLLIGGMPFHLQGAVTQDTPTYNYASNGSYSYASYPSHHLPPHSVYPVYETIGSDYSEMSSVYSDRLSAGSGVRLVHPQHLVDPSYTRHLVLHGSSNTISGSGRVITPEMALLQRLQEQQQQTRQVGVHGQQQRAATRSPLRNLPLQRSKSLKTVQRGPLPSLPTASPATSASTLSSTPPPPPTRSTTPPRMASVESTISLENPPSASSPITQL